VGDELTALDATFLELEEADQSAHMHIGAVILLRPQRGNDPPPIESVRADIVARLPDLPRYAQKLSEPHTGGLRWPSWVPDPDFHVDRHVYAAGLPAPARIPELLEWAGEFFSQRLDRTKPLWEIAVLELSDGRWAIATKTHHCMIDGVGSVDIGLTLLDSRPDADGRGRPAEPADNGDGPAESSPTLVRRLAAPALGVGHAAVRAAQAGLHAAESAAGVARHPSRVHDTLRRSRALTELIVRDELVSAPRTSLNNPIGTKRALAVVPVELNELRAIKTALGGTVNDVVLAAATGGFRHLLLRRGEELPEQGLRAMVPMNVRSAGDRLALGNRISSLFVHLPVAAANPARRYELQLEEAESLKASDQAEGSSTLVNLAGLMPPVLHSFAARSLFATRLFNVTVTNVPGPQFPLYYLGSRVEEIWPLVPIAAEHSVGVAVFSYDGRLYFCINADRDSVRDIDVLASGISCSIEELRQLALVG
jgi:WS/DGAT/MGAT family acyltransferase